MKYATLALMGIGLAIGSSIAIGQAPTPKGEPELKTLDQKFAYSIGLSIGRSMKADDLALDPDLIAKGIKDSVGGKPALTDEQIVEVQKAFQQLMMAKQQELMAKQAAAKGAAMGDPAKNLKAGRDFLAANKAKPGVTTLPSGLQYKVLKSGTGKTPRLSDSVLAHYKGTLIDGTEFDSSYKRGQAAEFPVSGVIPGWIEILQKMKVGDKWEVYIPTELAYGANPRGGVIKPNDALIFEMELVDVK
jgi:FKBP-type peptidyl-prolyl cis-trans isomerase FklB